MLLALQVADHLKFELDILLQQLYLLGLMLVIFP